MDRISAQKGGYSSGLLSSLSGQVWYRVLFQMSTFPSESSIRLAFVIIVNEYMTSCSKPIV